MEGQCRWVSNLPQWVVHSERLVDDTPHVRVSLADVELPNGVRFSQYVFLARGAQQVGAPELDEVRWVPLDEASAMVSNGEILGAITVIGVQHALLRRAGAPAPRP